MRRRYHSGLNGFPDLLRVPHSQRGGVLGVSSPDTEFGSFWFGPIKTSLKCLVDPERLAMIFGFETHITAINPLFIDKFHKD